MEVLITTVIIKTLINATGFSLVWPLCSGQIFQNYCQKKKKSSSHVPDDWNTILPVLPSSFFSCPAMPMPSVRVHRLDKFYRGYETEWEWEEKRESGVRFTSSPSAPWISFRAIERLISTVCKPIPLHWPDRATLETRPRASENELAPTQTLTYAHTNAFNLHYKSNPHWCTHTQPPTLKRKSQKCLTCRVNTCSDLLLSVVKMKLIFRQAPLTRMRFMVGSQRSSLFLQL